MPKGEQWFAIKPSAQSDLALAVAQGGSKQGTPIVLEKTAASLLQLWSLTKRENGAYSLTPKHAPGMGIDLLGGKQNPGAQVDLWTLNANDPHLQWFIRPLAGSSVVEAKAADDAPKYEPPAIKPEDILPGTTKQFTFAQSKIFPGTVRDVTVFVPAQYDGKNPACLYVKTDGFNPREKTLLETMIATKEMPVTVGVSCGPASCPRR